MTFQFSNNPGISVRICTDLYRFAGSAQNGCELRYFCNVLHEWTQITGQQTRYKPATPNHHKWIGQKCERQSNRSQKPGHGHAYKVSIPTFEKYRNTIVNKKWQDIIQKLKMTFGKTPQKILQGN